MVKWPQIRNQNEYMNNLSNVLLSDTWTIRAQRLGSKYLTEEFEDKWAKFCDKKYAILVSSGSSAIEICLLALNIKEGDEVIVPALGWYATAAAVTRVGATPIFCDVDFFTTCIDHTKICDLLTSKTKAIIAVHLHCSFAPLKELETLCKKHNIILLEDAAQAHGGKYLNTSPGYYSIAACYSFNQEKLIPCGEGGIIVTNNKDFYKKAYAIRTDGYFLYEDKGWLPSDSLGTNFAISEFQCAILLAAFKEFEYFNKIRLQNAHKIITALKNIEDISLIKQTREITDKFYYEVGIIFSDKLLSKLSLDKIIEIINTQNVIQVNRTDVPVPDNPLFSPYYKNKKHSFHIEEATKVYNSMIVIHHKYLLLEGIETILLKAINNVLSLCLR